MNYDELQDFVKREALKVAANKETLVAAYLLRYPDTKIEDIRFVQQPGQIYGTYEYYIRIKDNNRPVMREEDFEGFT